MSNKSFIDYAFDVLTESKQPLTFKELFNKVVALSGVKISEENLTEEISSFYTQLSTDGRFACLEDKKWDLVSRYAYDKVHIKDQFEDDDDSDSDEEEDRLLKAELGETGPESDEDLDDVDFDKPKKEQDDF